MRGFIWSSRLGSRAPKQRGSAGQKTSCRYPEGCQLCVSPMEASLARKTPRSVPGDLDSGGRANGSGDAHLEFVALEKTYETRDGPIKALDRVTFGVAKGEFVSIVGPSGCGKSTLLKIILGVEP